MSRHPITESDLHARVDGQLSPERAREVDEAAARDPALAARLDDLRGQNAWLRAGLDPLLDDVPPQRLLDAARAPAATAATGLAARIVAPFAALFAPRRAPLWAAFATLVIGVAIGWFGRDVLLTRSGMPVTFAEQMAYAHVLYASDPNRPVEMWAPEENRLVAWLSKRLDTPLRAPDLNQAGYALVGGRLVAGNAQPTAMFVYQNAAKERLTLQVRKNPHVDETAFRYAVADGVGVFYWIDDHCAYALAGDLDRHGLLAIGELVYQQLAKAEAQHTR